MVDGASQVDPRLLSSAQRDPSLSDQSQVTVQQLSHVLQDTSRQPPHKYSFFETL